MPITSMEFFKSRITNDDSPEIKTEGLSERHNWLIHNFKNISNAKYLFLMRLVNYAKDHFIAAAKNSANSRYDIFNNIFNPEIIEKEDIEFFKFVLQERQKITEIKSDLYRILSTADNHKDTLLAPYRKAIDVCTLTAIGFYTLDLAPMSLLPYVIALSSYYSLRESSLESAYKNINPYVDSLNEPYQNYVKPIGILVLRAPAAALSFFNGCRKHQAQVEDVLDQNDHCQVNYKKQK